MGAFFHVFGTVGIVAALVFFASMYWPYRRVKKVFAGRTEEKAFTWRRGAELLGVVVAWAWFIIAGGGGLGLIITTGPWPPTHGWFALFSGLTACPLTAWLSKKYLGLALPGSVRLAAAAFFIVLGRLALIFLWPRAR